MSDAGTAAHYWPGYIADLFARTASRRTGVEKECSVDELQPSQAYMSPQTADAPGEVFGNHFEVVICEGW